MSTRCQVKVVQEGVDWKEEVTLYHHWDGYPSNMLPVLHKGYEQVPKDQPWQAGRAGKAAAFLCASEPTGFEPEQGHALHGDIEWYYILKVSESGWLVDVYKTTKSWWFADKPSMKNMRLMGSNIHVSDASDAELKELGQRMEELAEKWAEEWTEADSKKLMDKYAKPKRSSPGKRAPGWFKEPARHSLAARGKRTKRKR